MQLTRDQLLKRGWCCNYRCLNCPYKENIISMKPEIQLSLQQLVYFWFEILEGGYYNSDLSKIKFSDKNYDKFQPLLKQIKLEKNINFSFNGPFEDNYFILLKLKRLNIIFNREELFWVYCKIQFLIKNDNKCLDLYSSIVHNYFTAFIKENLYLYNLEGIYYKNKKDYYQRKNHPSNGLKQLRYQLDFSEKLLKSFATTITNDQELEVIENKLTQLTFLPEDLSQAEIYQHLIKQYLHSRQV